MLWDEREIFVIGGTGPEFRLPATGSNGRLIPLVRLSDLCADETTGAVRWGGDDYTLMWM